MRRRLRQACSFFRIWCVVELVAALLGNVPVILLVGAEDLTVYKATSSLESEGAPIGAFQPNPAMLDTLVEMVDVGKAVASVEADRVRELGHVKEQVGVIPANCKAKGAIVAANHTMGVVPVLHATATRSLDPLRALDAQHGPALLASAAIGLVEGVELLLASAGAQETAGQALELSSAAGHPKVVLTILDHLGVKGSSDMTKRTETAFLEACQGGHASVAQVFLDRGIDTELRTNNQCVDRVEKPPEHISPGPSPARPECFILRSACCGLRASSQGSLSPTYSTPPGGPLSSSRRSAAASSCSSCSLTVAPRSMPPTAASGVRHSGANSAH